MTEDAAAERSHHRREALPLGLLGTLTGLYGWLVFAMAFGHDGVLGPYFNAPGADYMVYWRGVRAALAGDFALLGDPAALTAELNRMFRDWLTGPLPLHPWLYPPSFLLMLLPFAALPFVPSYVAFLTATFLAAAAAGGGCWAGKSRRRGLWLLGLAMAPATAVNAVAGQNALLTLALLLGGAGLLGRADVAAGAILGLLTYKPQFALLVPVALLALGNRRALAAAGASAALMGAASAAIFGLAPWRDWLLRTLSAGGPGDAAWMEAGRLWGLSAWACARVLGAPGWLANTAQMLAVVVGAAAVWTVFRRPCARERRLSVLLAGTLVAAPHSSPYDLVLLVPVVLLGFGALLDDAPALRPSLLLLPWAAPLAPVPRQSLLGLSTPAMVLALLLVLLVPVWRGGRAGSC